MKRLLLVFLSLPALLQTKKSFGQDSTSKVSVVVSPALFVPVSIAAQGGFQFKLGHRFGLLAEAAFPVFYPDNTEYEKIRYWRAGLELKYYLRKKGLGQRYVSFQNNYLFRELTEEQQGRYFTKTQTFSYSNALISSPVLSSAIKLGVEVPVGKGTYFDLFFGAGLRMIFTSYKTEVALVTSLEPNRHTLLKFDDAWIYNYTLTRLHATAGVRFGFRL